MTLANGTWLEVKAHADLDTHLLWWTHGANREHRSMVAEHANGHSLLVLAKRMLMFTEEPIRDQARYIQQCGGMTADHDALVRIAQPEFEG